MQNLALSNFSITLVSTDNTTVYKEIEATMGKSVQKIKCSSEKLCIS